MKPRCILSAMVGSFLLFLFVNLTAQDTVHLTVNPMKVVGKIDEKVYGQFLEHIYHSVNGGLWGDMIWNRSFEEALTRDEWSVKYGCLESPYATRETRMILGDGSWRDYEFTLEARKMTGSDGFFIGVRSTNGPVMGERVERDGYAFVIGAGANHRNDLEFTSYNKLTSKQESKTVTSISGQIEPEQWYRIRLRCEGKRIQAWINDSLQADFTNTTGPLGGWVSVGARNAVAQFRELKVKSLSGETLFEGLPTPARHWFMAGNGEVTLDAGKPQNSSLSLKIVAGKEKAGVFQKNISIRKGDVCRGSIWVRGDAPDGISVRLVDGKNKLEEEILPAPTSEWKMYPIRFNPLSDVDNATLQIVTLGKATVWVDQFCLMPNSASETGGYRPDLLKAVKDLKPSVVRWPGGAFLNGYRWKDGIGSQSKRFSKMGWDEVDPLSFGVDEYVSFCRKVGAEPLITVNIDRSNPDMVKDATDLVEYCNGDETTEWGKIRAINGHPLPFKVKYWEIGNEVWGMGIDAYVEAVRLFVPAMKKVDSSIVISVCGSGGLGREGIGLDWNRTIIEKCPELIDFLSIHHYEGARRFASGPTRLEGFIRETGSFIAASANPKMKIFISEWNAQTTDWRTGLYCGGMLNTFERNGNLIGMATPALLLRHVSAPGWDNAFVNFDQRSWFAAPNYLVMKLWREHYAPNCLELTGDSSKLNIVVTKTEDEKHLFVKAVNPTPNQILVNLRITEGFNVGHALFLVLSPGVLDARNTMETPAKITPQRGEVKRNDKVIRFTMVPFSAGVVSLKTK